MPIVPDLAVEAVVPTGTSYAVEEQLRDDPLAGFSLVL